MSQLRRQFAYDRLLARIFTDPSQSWILKGGVGMLARLSTARHSADIDLATRADSPAFAFDALKRVAAVDLGDFFTFRFDPPRHLVQGVEGLRIRTEARLGPRPFERFGVDLVTGTHITGDPETAAPILPMHIPGLIRPSYRLYPLVDTIADKVMAITEKHNSRPSTRYRDLVDLVLIARTQALFADDAMTALESECLRRNIPLPQSFAIPDRTIWQRGYTTVAAEVPELDETTLDEALGTTRALLDPILNRQVHRHRWNPGALTWEEVE